MEKNKKGGGDAEGFMRVGARWVFAVVVVGSGLAWGQDTSVLTQEEIKGLVEAGRYKDALQPIFRALALKGEKAAGYDRVELYMMRAECQVQLKDQSGALATLASAKKEAFDQRKFDRMAEPTALAMLLQKSNAWLYKGKGPAKEGISILDRTLRSAAYAALFNDEVAAVKAKVESLATAKTMGPVQEAAKLLGPLRAVEIMSKPEAKGKDLATAPLVTLVTVASDRLMGAASDDYAKQAAAISSNANQIVKDTVPMYDSRSGKSWMQPRTRRRGPSDDEVKVLNNIVANCDKIHSLSAEIAASVATDFDAYEGIVKKALAAKAKAAAVLADDYLQLPP